MRAARIIGITALLAALGGLAGALGGVLIALGLIVAVDTMPASRVLLGVFQAAGTIGFLVGVLAGPVLSWTLLRRAPIWRAIGETAVAAGLAAAVALAFGGGLWTMIGWSVFAATLAALRLQRSITSSTAAASSEVGL